jgi:hypothetical protein
LESFLREFSIEFPHNGFELEFGPRYIVEVGFGEQCGDLFSECKSLPLEFLDVGLQYDCMCVSLDQVVL